MTLGVLGGTFDPIHLGHIAAADAAQRALTLHNVVLVPSRIPPHRADPTTASAEDRFAMAQLAATSKPGWSASRVEIDREGPSYTYDTLLELGGMFGTAAPGLTLSEPSASRSDGLRESKGTQLFFITGADAFAEIATWSRYPAVLDLANFVVVSRPGITLDSVRARVPSAFPSTSLRAGSRNNAKTRVIFVEALTPDVSSTEIRRRVRAGERLSGLVPDAVERYIRTHNLYR